MRTSVGWLGAASPRQYLEKLFGEPVSRRLGFLRVTLPGERRESRWASLPASSQARAAC